MLNVTHLRDDDESFHSQQWTKINMTKAREHAQVHVGHMVLEH